MLHAGNAAIDDVFPRSLGGNNFDTCGPGARIRFVPLVVVPVEMRIDNVFHGLVSDCLDLCDQSARRGGLRVCVHQQQAVVEHDDGRIAVDLVLRLCDGRVNTRRHLFDFEKVFRADERQRLKQRGDGQQNCTFH